MRRYDYIIIGQGIAGSVMALRLMMMSRSVLVVSDPSLSSSSAVAAGVYNPFNFRRMGHTWNAVQCLPEAIQFYAQSELLTQTKFHYSRKIIRIFLSEQEREEWFAAFEKHKGVFAATEPWKDSLNGQLKLPFGAGQITTAGNVYTPAFLEAVRSLLTARNAFLREKVSYEKIEVMHDEVRYDQKVSASKIIFCEGHLALNNPFIATPFVKPMKGEVLHLNIPDLKTEHVLSSGCYLMPAGEGKFICGSNYEGRRIDEQPTEEIRRELTEKVSNMINCDFEITAHVAGIRPTVYDHRPVVGVTENSRVAVFNGLGSKGILQAPLLSGLLSEELENGRPVPEEISPLRFARRAARKKQQ